MDASPSHATTAFASSLLVSPQRSRLPWRLAGPDGSTTGVPRSVLVSARGRSALSAGGHPRRPVTRAHRFLPPYLCGPSVTALSACRTSRRFSVLHGCGPSPALLAPDPLSAGSRHVGSRSRAHPPACGSMVPAASHPTVTSDAPAGRRLLADQLVMSRRWASQIPRRLRVAPSGC